MTCSSTILGSMFAHCDCSYIVCRGLLKSGLGRFGLVQKQPQPGDYATIIVFVVGGVSVADMRHVRHVVGEAASRQSDRTLSSVLLGGTTLISPQDVVSGLFRW
jgi:hypothetical protein